MPRQQGVWTSRGTGRARASCTGRRTRWRGLRCDGCRVTAAERDNSSNLEPLDTLSAEVDERMRPELGDNLLPEQLIYRRHGLDIQALFGEKALECQILEEEEYGWAHLHRKDDELALQAKLEADEQEPQCVAHTHGWRRRL
jgi:hypothetical protein